MTDTYSERDTKLPTFDGKAEKFMMWWRRFKAYAQVHKFGAALQEGGDPDMPDAHNTQLDETKDEDKAKLKALQRNAKAIASLTMAITDEATMGFIDKGCDATKWPEGHMGLIVDALIKKYKPVDVMSEAELERDLRKIRMKRNDDPTAVFSALSNLELKYKQTFSVQKKMATILSICPVEYKSIITNEARRLGTALTIAELEAAMNFHFRAIQFGDNAIKPSDRGDDDDDDDDELGMAAMDLTCNYCKAKGHMIKNCPKLAAKGQKQRNNV